MPRQFLLLFLLTAATMVSAGTRKTSPTIIDLTDTIRVGMVEDSIGDAAMKAFGIDEVSTNPEMTFQKTTGRSTRICLSSQIGTHMDAGAHADPDGWPANEAPMDHLIVPGVVVDVRAKTDDEGITPADLEKYDIRPGDAVLFLAWRTINVVRASTGWIRQTRSRHGRFIRSCSGVASRS